MDGYWVSRTGYSGEIGYEVFCPTEGAESLWRALLDAGAGDPVVRASGGGVAADRVGLIFLGYDYFQGVTSPFHMNLDRMIKLDKEKFVGRRRCAPRPRPGSPTAW